MRVLGLDRGMALALSTPAPEQLGEVLEVLSSWQEDGLPVQLHPGDLGWAWRFGPVALARVLRVWRADDAVVAMGFLDDDGLIRMAVAPAADHDEELARTLAGDLEDPAQGVLDGHRLVVEARFGTAFRSLLPARGWVEGNPWAPLVRDLGEPVAAGDVRIEVVGPDRVDDLVDESVEDRVAVQRAAFPSSTFTVERWHVMSRSPAYRRARCLVAYDDRGDAVAAVTVWSAGVGRPGLLEPMGVHHDHRGRGYGRAITVAATAALRVLGASSALVATSSANTAGVATYVAAGFRRRPDVPDLVLTR